MHIDHTWHTGVVAKIDDFRSRRNGYIRSDALNLVVFDDDDGVRDCAVSVPQLSKLDGLSCRFGVLAEGKQSCEDG